MAREADVTSATMSPAFSARLRRLDPLLAEEDTNGLFQAFRARRLLHSRSWRARLWWWDIQWKNLVGALLFLGAALYPFIRLILYEDFLNIPAPVWPFVFGIMLAYTIADAILSSRLLPPIRTGATADERVPLSLGHVLNHFRGDRWQLVDLWLTPQSGGEVARALYLEDREILKRRRLLEVGIWVVLLVGMIVLTLSHGTFELNGSYAVMLACFGFFCHAYYVSGMSGGKASLTNAVAPALSPTAKLLKMTAARPSPLTLLKDILYYACILVILVLVGLCGVYMIGMTFIVFLAWETPFSPDSAPPFVYENFHILVIAGIALAGALILHARAWIARRRHPRIVARRLAEAEKQYEALVRAMIDPG